MRITVEDKVQEALGLKDTYNVWLEISEDGLDASYTISEIIHTVAIGIKEVQNKIGKQLKRQALSYIKSHPTLDLDLDNFSCMALNINKRKLNFFLF